MTEDRDNPLERLLDEFIYESRREGSSAQTDAEATEAASAPEQTTSLPDASGRTSRAYRFLADDAVIKEILQDMAEVSYEELDELDSARFGTGEYKSLDQVARETGLISFEQQDAVFRSYLERRVDELKEKLLGAQLGSYSIIDELGRGGMGIVFRARQESPMFTREVALKFMLAGPESEAHDRERFVAEVKGLAGLSHPFLVPIFDSGIEGDLYYFSMEFIDGQTLSASAVTEDLSIDKKVEIVRDIARALDYLHDQGVIHRDVKPGNIMLDRHGNAMLLDFGIAQFSADPRRRVAQAGTPFYMAPEVIDPGGRFGPIGPGTDIYALGAVLYKLLTGQEVFPCEDDLTEVFRKTLHSEPSFSTTRRRIVHPDLERIMRRCLRKRVDDRYPKAGELANDLDRFLKRSRIRWPHLVGALLLVLVSVITAAVGLREADPTPEQLAAEASRRAAEKVEEARGHVREVRRSMRLETSQPAADVEALLGSLNQLDELAAEAGIDGGETRFNKAFDAFCASAAKDLHDKADAIMRALSSRVVAVDPENLSWGEGWRSFHDAKRSRTTTSKLHGYLVAIDSFARAEEETREKLQREKNRTAAENAQRSAQRAWESLKDEEDLAAVSPRAQEQFGQGDDLRNKAQNLFTLKSYPEAGDHFQRAEKQYKRAAATLERDRKSFADDKRRLQNEAEGFLTAEFNHNVELYRLNVPESSKMELQTILEERGSIVTTISLATKLDELRKLKERLGEWRAATDKAKREFERVRTEAKERRDKTLPPLEHPVFQRVLHRLPVQWNALAKKVKQLSHAAEMAFSEQRYRDATRDYAALEAACLELLKDYQDLSRGMQWIEGGQVDGHRVDGFWIDQTEVTVGTYREYLYRHGSGALRPLGWKSQTDAARPVVGVDSEMAREFAEAHGKTLPDVDQWRLARPHVRDSETFDAAEWIIPSGTSGAAAGDAILTYRNTQSHKEDVALVTIQKRAGFRCVLKAQSWELAER